jgi:hypothetical protein
MTRTARIRVDAGFTDVFVAPAGTFRRVIQLM